MMSSPRIKLRWRKTLAALLQGILDSYEAGIQVTAVLLQEVKAPEEVRAAFEDVNSARQDQETVINLAQAYEREPHS